MRITQGRAAVAVIAVLLLTVGCGSDDKKDASSTPTPTATPTPLTAAQAQVLAKAAVLTEADMPGYKAEKETHDTDDQATEERVATCLGLPKPTYVARDFGTTFSKGDVEVESSADVAPTAAAARTELEALTGEKAEGCLKTEFEQLVGVSGGAVTKFELTPVDITVNGADDAFGFKLEFAASAAGQTLAFTGYDVGALVGQVEIDVSVFDSSGSGGFTVEQATALLQKVTDRTRAAA